MLTVIFATHNGACTLPAVLAAYCRLEIPSGGWKLIVVDNASADATREIVSSFCDRLPITYLYEEQPGKNAALNSSLAHIEGDLVFLTDDDVFPGPDWLVRMKAAADTHPEFSIFGGVVLPRWEVAPPKWIVDWVPLGPVFTLTAASTPDGPVAPECVYGPNMVIRSEIFRRGYRFDATIGPRGKSYAMGSETEFVVRLTRLGHSAWHVRDAEVEHYIREFQMRRPWILRRAIRFGRGQYRVHQVEQRVDMATVGGIPGHLFNQILLQGWLVLKGLVCLDHEKAFRARWEFNVVWGQVVEARNLCGTRTAVPTRSTTLHGIVAVDNRRAH
ncbi:MAG TPA: glycosyltransferase [Gemmatimonadaceae bacterium]|jgi:glycosyltransferase involved in cell wall biosynthesis|nr:glycosyltransferase [Gemmatimonadaceae bacterium]